MTKFTDLGLDPKVLQAIAEAGYDTPTPIQAQAIPHALEGRDVLGIAQTGTGKTASFVLPMLTMLAKGRARARMPRSLVLAPTRELAAQVSENFETYAKHMKLTMALLIGGTSFKDQDRLIDRGVDVLIATPGRLLDHFERGKLMLTGVQIMVVDEADRMLDMGFIPDIERIFKLTPFTRQTMFYSATMAPEITRITQEFLSNPVRVEVARQATTSETIDQFVCKHKPSRRDSSDKEKRDVLRRLIEAEGDKLTNAIIFCNRKRDVDIVAKSLQKHGFDAAPIHGDLDQSVRTRTLDGFREGKLKLLIASDVAARGLDVPSVSHVINFDVPTHPEDYVHRIGRTGRAGRDGKALTLCFPHEQKYLDAVEELVKKSIPLLESPLGKSTESVAETTPEDAPKPKSRTRSRSPKAEATTPPKPQETPKSAPSRSADRRDRGRGSDRHSGKAVVGMGDHVPAFILRAMNVEDLLTERAAEIVPEADETIAEDTPKPKKTRTRKPRKTKAEKDAEAAEAAANADAPPVTDEVAKDTVSEPEPAPATVAEATTETAAEAKPEVEAKPAKKPRKRVSAKAVVAEATGAEGD